MAAFDYTILTQAPLENRVSAICEFAVPAGNNAAGVGWQAIVSATRALTDQVGTTIKPGASAAHITALDDGSLIELSITVEYDAKLAAGAKLTEIESLLNAEMDQRIAEFTSRYRYAGKTGSVT